MNLSECPVCRVGSVWNTGVCPVCPAPKRSRRFQLTESLWLSAATKGASDHYRALLGLAR